MHPTKKQWLMNYLSGIVVVAIGVTLGFFTKDVNSILQWIVSGLYGGYIAANVLKWYWWRFNANGFFWGMFAGTAGALIFSHFFSRHTIFILFSCVVFNIISWLLYRNIYSACN